MIYSRYQCCQLLEFQLHKKAIIACLFNFSKSEKKNILLLEIATRMLGAMLVFSILKFEKPKKNESAIKLHNVHCSRNIQRKESHFAVINFTYFFS